MPGTALSGTPSRLHNRISSQKRADGGSNGKEFLRLLNHEFGVARRRALAARKERRRRIGLREPGTADSMLLPSAASDRRAPGRLSSKPAEWKVMPRTSEEFPSFHLLANLPPSSLLSESPLPTGADGWVADAGDPVLRMWLASRFTGTRSPGPKSRFAEAAAPLFLRPRGLEFETQELLADGASTSAAFFDIGAHCFASAGGGLIDDRKIFFSLPGIESREEAQLWREVLRFIQRHLGLGDDSIRVLIPIETVAAAIEMDAILGDLREFAIGLAGSPVRYLTNFAVTFRTERELILPDCSNLTLEQPFLRAYQDLLVHTSHRHGALAFCAEPVQRQFGSRVGAGYRDRTEAELSAHLHKEFALGFDGVALSEMGSIPTALHAISGARRQKTGSRQHDRICFLSSRDLLSRPFGPTTLEALRDDIVVALKAIDGSLNGAGHQEGSSTGWAAAEFCRAQISQWLRHSIPLDGVYRLDRRTLSAIVRDCAVATESDEHAPGTGSMLSAANLLLAACDEDADVPLSLLLAAYPGAA